MICFLSSPFTEPVGIEWPARRRLYDRLKDEGHTPWLYEVEGEEFLESGEDPEKTITRAIDGADVVIMFFKTRSGSSFPDGPFRGTDYEYWEARKLGKPVYLYLIGHLREPSLNATLSIISDPLLLMRDVRLVESDGDELAQAVVSDLKREIDIRSRSNCEDLSRENRVALIDLDRSWLEQELNTLQVSASGNLWSAAQLANRIPILPPMAQSKIDPRLNRLYAGVLDVCGGILGNQWRYDEAIKAKKLSIRYFSECGATREMIAQVQALSGILNMARRAEAFRVNEYGFDVASHSFPELLPAFLDSRASILARFGNQQAARQRMLDAIKNGEPSPYLLSKHARAIAASRKPSDVRLASRIIFDDALPMARTRNRDLGYVLRDAAYVATLDREFLLARLAIAEAEANCLERGELHTLSTVKQVKALLSVMSSRHPGH